MTFLKFNIVFDETPQVWKKGDTFPGRSEAGGRRQHLRPGDVEGIGEGEKTMNSAVWVMLAAVVGGAAISIQGQLLSLMDKDLGTLEGVFLTYAGGGLLISLAMLAVRGGKLGSISAVPWYALLSGAAGLVIVGTIGYSARRLGLVTAFTIMVAAQFITGVLIDQFGLMGARFHPIDLTRSLGIFLTLSGVWLILR